VSDPIHDLIIGVGIGAGVVGVIFWTALYFLVSAPRAECTRTHNVYQCEMIFVPKAKEPKS